MSLFGVEVEKTSTTNLKEHNFFHPFPPFIKANFSDIDKQRGGNHTDNCGTSYFAHHIF
jgi:hypothetical protein